MAKIVSAVPKLLTSTLGVMASDSPKPIVVEVPVSTPATNTKTDTDQKADESVSGPDLSENLDSITERSRGRTGTITTSFRGVLNDSTANLSRRTLLGE